MIRSHFAGCVSEQGDMQKGSFQRWCKESSHEVLICIFKLNNLLTIQFTLFH